MAGPVPSLPHRKRPPASSLVLITGGGGYVGSALADHLLAGGWSVRLLEVSARTARSLRRRLTPPGKGRSLEIQVGDVCHPGDIRRACRDVTHVVHLAGMASVSACRAQPQRAIEINGLSTRYLLECMRDAKGFRRFIYPSSVAGMYTVPRRGRILETTPVFPVDDYGISKSLGEQFCRAYARLFGAPTVIFRQSNVYGPSPVMKFDNVVHAFVKGALAGKPLVIHGSGVQERDFLYLGDLVRAYESALRCEIPPGRLYNVCSGEKRSIRQVAEAVARGFRRIRGEEIRVKHKTMEMEEIEIRRYSILGSRASHELGFVPEVAFEEGIRRLIETLAPPKAGRK
ncbi:MAG: NAD-dependent epimerase/dehydratase family protein [Nitrospinota bacterium]